METEVISYSFNNKEYKGFLAYDATIEEKRPVILIFHAFDGCTELMQRYAINLAKEGYVGFAVDMYGDGKIGNTKEECFALLDPFRTNRQHCLDVVLQNVEFAKTIPQVDSSKVAAIGFCFGGMCVLDLARSGADVAAVVSLHGNLTVPEEITNKDITSSILVLNGYLDPHVPVDHVSAFMQEMTDAKADWQLHNFSDTYHSFTEPDVDRIGGKELGRVYNPLAAARSWEMILQLFNEKF